MPDTASAHDPFGARASIDTPLGSRTVYRLDSLRSIADIDRIPYSVKVLLEAVLRNHDGHIVEDEDVRSLASYDASKVADTEIAFKPGRVVLQDFTGVPAVVDLAAMRSRHRPLGPGRCVRLGGSAVDQQREGVRAQS
jgi:aconitate hydratase